MFKNYLENEKRENEINKNGCFVSPQLQLNGQQSSHKNKF